MAALIIAALSVCISLASFYFSEFGRPRIRMIVERRIRTGGTGKSGFQFYIPITFINRAHRLGIIHRITLTVADISGANPTHQIDASRFCKLEDTKFSDAELSHAFAVPGRSTVNKLIRFVWWDKSTPHFDIGHGTFRLRVEAWTHPIGARSLVSEHVLELSADNMLALHNARQESKASIIEVELDGAPPNNRVIDTPHMHTPSELGRDSISNDKMP